MNTNFIEVVQHVNEYFKKHLPQYTVCEVRRQSYNPKNDYLYMVSAVKEDGTYAFWSSFNETIQSLNHGHYDLPSLEVCAKLMEDYQNGTLYAEKSTSMEVLQELLVKHDDDFESSYQELLYIRGFIDGINAQQENNWDKLNETEVNTLLAKAVEV